MVIKKIQKAGHAKFVYLPIEWTRKVGNEIDVSENESGQLILHPPEYSKKVLLKKEVNIKKADINLIRRIAASLYINGYDEFTITLQEPLTQQNLKKLRKLFFEIGMDKEIMEFEPDKLRFKTVVSVFNVFDMVYSSAGKLLDLIRSIEQNEKEIAKQYSAIIEYNDLLILKSFNTILKKPMMLSGFEITANAFFNLVHISYSFKHLSNIFMESKKIENTQEIKKVIEIMQKLIKNPKIEEIEKISEIIKKVDNKKIYQEFKIIERKFLNLVFN